MGKRFAFADCILDTNLYELRRRGQPVPLTPKAFDLLVYLIEHRHRVVSREDLIEAVWKGEVRVPTTLDTCLMEARRAVGDSGETQQVIKNRRGRGYRFIAPVEEQDEESPTRLSGTEPLPPVSRSPEPECGLGEATLTMSPVPEAQAHTQRSAPATPLPSEPERRPVTVLSCGLVGYEPLAEQLDRDDCHKVIHDYYAICDAVIEQFNGHIAQLSPDRLLVYFGYPQAQEDAARRAVRVGLGIIAAIESLNAQLTQGYDMRLATRIGLDTGMVIVEAMGSYEALMSGEAPRRAAQLQALAAPNTLVVSDATYHLVQKYFVCDNLGLHGPEGGGAPVYLYRIMDERINESAVESPLVGREQEVGLLQERWGKTKEGQGQVILISGEAGIGKSRLVQMLKDYVEKDYVEGENSIRLECRSSPYYQNTPLYPVLERFQRALQWQQHASDEEKLQKLETMLSQYNFALAEVVPLFASLLSLPLPDDRYPSLRMTPQQQRWKTLEALVTIPLKQAEQHPILFILEDLHWTDPSTLELLDLLIDQTPATSILTLLTCRPDFQPGWGNRSYLRYVTLDRLSPHHVERVVKHVAKGKRLPSEVLQLIVEKTDGVPLYVEECTKAVLESGFLREVDDHYELTGSLPDLAIPFTLQDSLMARLDRLGTAKGVAQLAATIGKQFSYALLRKVAQLEDATLQQELRKLVKAELVFVRGLPPEAMYTFKHTLIQEAAQQSLLKSTRQQYHLKIAQELGSTFPEVKPELLAHHYTEAGLLEQSITYWQRAGQQAVAHSAHLEAISHLSKGLELLNILPATPERLQQEIHLRVALGPALIATKGHAAPDVERTYSRARKLCQQTGDTQHLFPVLRGLILYYMVRGQLQTAHQLGEQLLRLAYSQPESALRMLAHHQLGMILFWWGEPASAYTHHTQAVAIYNPQEHRALAVRYGTDLGSASHTFLAWELWCLGYPDQALRHSQAACILAQEVSYPYSLTQALVWAAGLHQFRREALAAHEQAAAATTLATEHGFALWAAYGTVLHGWARAMQGQGKAGIAEIRQGLAAELAMGAKTFQPYFLGLLAAAYGEGGHPEAELPLLAEAEAMMDATEARWYQAELYRLKGALLLRQEVPDAPQAETCFRQALDTARRQQAKSLELRAAMSLSRLWQQQGKHVEAYELLVPIYGWFTEGFDTADLQEAKALLDALS